MFSALSPWTKETQKREHPPHTRGRGVQTKAKAMRQLCGKGKGSFSVVCPATGHQGRHACISERQAERQREKQREKQRERERERYIQPSPSISSLVSL